MIEVNNNSILETEGSTTIRSMGDNTISVKDKGLHEDLDEYYQTKKETLENVLQHIHFNEPNKNARLLEKVKNVIINFIRDNTEEIQKIQKEAYNHCKESYAKTMNLKKCKMIGSFKKKMSIHNHLNIDIAVEYELNTKIGTKKKYKNFINYHNDLIEKIKQVFYKKDFDKKLKENPLKSSVTVSMKIVPWLHTEKDILLLHVTKGKKYVGSIKVILVPSKKVQNSFQKIVCEQVEVTSKQMIRLCCFLQVECNIIECEHMVEKTCKEVKEFNKAVQMLKYWCRNNRLFFTESTSECSKCKIKGNKTYKNFTYLGGINSFLLCLLCSYVSYTSGIMNHNANELFSKTIEFISTMDINTFVYVYQQGQYKQINRNSLEMKKKGIKCDKSNPVFLINTNYDVFENNKCALLELIEEAKKANYLWKSRQFSQLFLQNYNCFQMNYEEEIILPFFFETYNKQDYDKKLAFLKKQFIRSLEDRIEELSVRWIRYECIEKEPSKQKSKKRKQKTSKSNETDTRYFQEMIFNKSNIKNETNKQIKLVHTVVGCTFMIKTNNTQRNVNVSKNMYKPDKTSSFKKFWGKKTKVQRFKNNTIFEIIQWSEPGRLISKRKIEETTSVQNKKVNEIEKCNEESIKNMDKEKKNMYENEKNVKEDRKKGKKHIIHTFFNNSSNNIHKTTTNNAFFDSLFSEANEYRTNSVHKQIIKYVLKKMKYKECTSMKNCLNKKLNYFTTMSCINICNKGKKDSNKKHFFYVYLSNPLLIKDIYFKYYTSICDHYNEIKSILYEMDDERFTINNIQSSNNILKRTDLGFKKNKEKMIEVIVDIKFNKKKYKEPHHFFVNYEIAKTIMKDHLSKGSFEKVEQNNFGINLFCKNTIFRIHVIVSKTIQKPLLQITNFDDVKITEVEQLDKIKSCIFDPLISAFIAYYSSQFSSFSNGTKICKLWLMSNGIYNGEQLVEQVLFYLFQLEFEKHNKKNYFYKDRNMSIGNNQLQEFLKNYPTLFLSKKNTQKDPEKSINTRPHSNNVANYMKQMKKEKKNKKDQKQTKENGLANAFFQNNKYNPEEDQYLESFSFCTKTVLIKFLLFLINFDWDNKPLIIDYDNTLSEVKKTKLINSFLMRKKNGSEQRFWISSVYDPHCILITLPHRSFDLIKQMAYKTLEQIKEWNENFENKQWTSLFLLSHTQSNFVLYFMTPEKAYKELKKKMKEENIEYGKKEQEKEKEQEFQEGREIEQVENKENDIKKNEEIYDLSYLNNTKKYKKKNVKSYDIMKKLKKSELQFIYKKHFEHLIKDLEQKFGKHIHISYNPICFDNILDMENFKNNCLLKKENSSHLKNKNIQCIDIINSWKPVVQITYNPTNILTYDMSKQDMENESSKNQSLSLALNNYNLFIYYLQNSTCGILKKIKCTNIM